MNSALSGTLQQLSARKAIEPAHAARAGELRHERAQAAVRLTVTGVVLAYLVASGSAVTLDPWPPSWPVFMAGFAVLSAVVLALTLRAAEPSAFRRMALTALDIGAVSYVMAITGQAGVPLFALYLWITVAIGLRFGPATAVAGAVLSLAGFAAVVSVAPVWQEAGSVSVAVFISLVALYLSIALGNGSRFGRQAMILGAVLSLTGFSAVLALSPAWADLTSVAVAVIVVLALLPLCARLIGAAGARRAQADDARLERLPPRQRPGAVARAAGAKPPGDAGRERGQALVRLANSLLVFVYLIIYFHPLDLDAGLPHWFMFSVGFIAFCALMLVLAKRPAASKVRRAIGNIGDVGAISYIMIATGTAGIPLFILYLSTTFGNGFRFGLAAMKVSAVLSLVGFLAVIALSPVWQELPITVPIGVFLALVLLPAYASHLIRQLASATRRAEEASAAKSHFIARMSHDLRTPLTGILGTAELLETNKRLTREDRSLLRVIKDSVKVSMRQIDNVLDFSKIEAGKLAIEQVDFDLHEVLNRATRLVRAVALEKGLRLILRVDPAVPYDLVGDPHHLNEVLLNLLSNGIKFTERGYVSLEARLVEADERSALVRFEVHDTGIGMDPAAIARIFDAFSQADTSTTRRYGGTGLGTTIAKQLVELMGGRLRVESVRGKGTVFSADLRFPRQGEPDARGDAVVGGPIAGARVLLVTSDPALADRLASTAKEWGASSSAVASVSEAVGFLARGIRLGNPAHAVLADARCVFDSSGAHGAEDFTEKAALSATPAFLVCDVSPGAAQLRRWGYAGALSYDAPPALLFSALHSSYTVEVLDERGVVQVEPWAWGQAGRAKPRVLVADDNRTNLMILRKILERANYDVDTADNGNQALDMLQRNRYKVAVLDMHMPGRDGVDVMREYRFSRHGARTPIIMLTANATMDAKVESADAGADAYLTKPATGGDVLSTIKKVLDDSEVYELRLGRGPGRLAAPDVPLLNTEVISDLDRLYGDPGDMKNLLDTFESDSRRLLHELKTAIDAKDQPRFRDRVHALKGNAANIGALRLVQVCYEVEHLGVLDIYRDGRKLLEQFESLLLETLQALRAFTAAGESALKSGPHTPAGPGVL